MLQVLRIYNLYIFIAVAKWTLHQRLDSAGITFGPVSGKYKKSPRLRYYAPSQPLTVPFVGIKYSYIAKLV